jgi:Zinc-binding loop region of homing endonuclease
MPLIHRLITAYSKEGLIEIFVNAKAKAQTYTRPYNLDQFPQVSAPSDILAVLYTSEAHAGAQAHLPPDLACKVVSLDELHRYPMHKLRLDTVVALASLKKAGLTKAEETHIRNAGSSVSLDLHRMCAWEKRGYDDALLPLFDKLQAVHPCHVKNCFEHAYFGSKARNSHTETCPVYINMSDLILVKVCKHVPPCLWPGGQVRSTTGTESLGELTNTVVTDL